MFTVGVQEMIAIFVLALVLFGKTLPELAPISVKRSPASVTQPRRIRFYSPQCHSVY